MCFAVRSLKADLACWFKLAIILKVSDADFLSVLPVMGDTGWTYRNVFCARCNYVQQYYFWNIRAQCVRSAPDEVSRLHQAVVR